MHRFLRTRPTRLTIVLLITLPLFAVAACGSNNNSGDDDSDTYAPPLATTASAYAGQSESTSGGEMPAVYAPPSDDQVASAPAGFDQLVIRTGQVTLQVSNVGDALGWVRSVAGARAGYVFASSSYVQDERQFAQITLKVPAESFDDVMNELRSGALVEKVEREESTSQDVTAEYVDNESLLSSLRETQSRFLALLSKAETVDDILRLEYELSNVRSQIETLQGRQNYLSAATSFATITVSLYPTGATEPKTADTGFNVSKIVESSWEQSRAVVQGALTVALTLLILGATFLPFALAGWFVLRFVRNRRRAQTVSADGA